MARKSANQNSFTGGELSSLLLGSQGFEEYYNKGLFVCLNSLPLTQGPWTRRPGTAFLHQAKFHHLTARAFPFQYSTAQTYTLEFGEFYIRFLTGHGILVNTSQPITSITKANPGVVTKIGHGYVTGNRLQLSSVLGMTQLNNRDIFVEKLTNDTFELWEAGSSPAHVKVDTTNYGTFTSGTMAKIFEVVTTYSEAQLADINIRQSADTLYITHPDHPPRTLVRVSALSWTLADILFTDGPYGPISIAASTIIPPGLKGQGGGVFYTSTTLTPGAATGNTIVTASAVDGINGGIGFVTTDVGRLIRLLEGSTWGYCVITAWVSATQVTVTVLSTLTNINAKANWRLGIWSATTGYPVCSTFHDDRLYFGGSALYPQRVDGSSVNSYTTFSPSATDGTVANSDAVAITLNSDDVNAIVWLASHDKGLLVGTTRGEWRIRGSNQDEAVAPTNISPKPQTRRGSASVAPIVTGDAVLFVQRGGRKVREMANIASLDKFKTPDMTAVAEHITAPGVSQLAYQEQPQPIVWAVRDDGVLLGLLYDRESNVVAWHRHPLGGDGLVESLAVVVDPTETRDELYLVVKRTINGGTKRYIEYMSKIWEPGIDVQEDAFQGDCGAVDLVAGTTITGLWFLEGETVGAYIDGKAHPDITISNGIATFGAIGTIKTLGYKYNSDGQTMPLEGGSQDGTAQGKIKIIKRIGFWLLDTLGLKYGPDVDNLTELLERDWGAEMGVATALATGVRRERFDGSHDRLGQVYWRCDGMFPATVCALLPQFDVSDDS